VSAFKPEWVDKVKGHAFDPNCISTTAVREWWRLNKGKNTYYCALCVTCFADGSTPEVRQTKGIQTLGGTYRANKDRNTFETRHHGEDSVHIAALKYKSSNVTQKVYETADIGYHQATANMLMAAYSEMFSNSPFSEHKTLVALLKEHNVSIGSHHDKHYAASEMDTFISDEMHDIFVGHLVKENKMFNLLVDGITDKSKSPHMIVLIQTLVVDHLIVYF